MIRRFLKRFRSRRGRRDTRIACEIAMALDGKKVAEAVGRFTRPSSSLIRVSVPGSSFVVCASASAGELVELLDLLEPGEFVRLSPIGLRGALWVRGDSIVSVEEA